MIDPSPPLMLAVESVAFDASGPVGWALSTLLGRVQFVLYLFVAIGLVLSTIHLATMFATRWGDRRVSGKSLGFSGGLHVLLLLAIAPTFVRQSSAYPVPPQPMQEIVRVTTTAPIEGNLGAGKEGVTGAAPWDRLPEYDRKLERLEQEIAATPQEVVPVDRPELDRGPQPLANTEAALPAPVSDAEPQLAKADVWPKAGPQAMPLELDTLQPEARPEMPAPSRQRTRSQEGLPNSDAAVPQPTPRVTTRRSRRRAPDPARFDLPDLTQPAKTDDAVIAEATPSDRETDGLGPAPNQLAAELATESSRQGPQDRQSMQPRPSRSRQSATVGEQPDGLADAAPLASARPVPARRRRRSVPMARLPETNEKPLEQPDLAAGGFAPSRQRTTSGLPNPYRNRAIDDRLETAQKFGGSASTEAAVERALKFLADAQSSDGRWDASDYGAGTAEVSEDSNIRNNTGREADSGVTGLCLLAYLGAGNTTRSGPYKQTVRDAISFLMSEQREDGYLGGLGTQTGDEQIAGAYCHAIATFALAETMAIESDQASGQTSDQTSDAKLRGTVERALQYTYRAQLSDGGWRYIPRQKYGGDMSIFGWHLMSLKSAGYAGVDIPDDVTEQTIGFLQDRSIGPNRGLAAYRRGERPTPSMTAEALFCRQMLGLPRDHPSSREGVSFVLQATPTPTAENFYYWYYGTLAMYQYGGDPWQEWNGRLQAILTREQNGDGSWTPGPSEPWGRYGGDLYSTALATLCLEVYYRYLPLYRQGGDLAP